MSSSPYLAETEFVKVMSNAFDAHLRQKLRERIIAAIEPEIESAINDAMAQFKIVVQKFRDHAMDETVLKVILDDRRK